jgi:hypothetical protein
MQLPAVHDTLAPHSTMPSPASTMPCCMLRPHPHPHPCSFKSDNILNLELDMPERTTYDYEGPGVDPRVQAAINAAFADDGELLFVGSGDAGGGGGNSERVYDAEAVAGMDAGGRPGSARRRPGSARRTSKAG